MCTNCNQCGVEPDLSTPVGKCGSDKCTAKLQATRRCIVTCEICGVSFEAKIKRAKFCSLKCKAKKAYRRYKHTCQRCGKEFTHEQKNSQKFCSASCGLSATSPTIKKLLTCVECNRQFEFFGRTSAKRCVDCRKVHKLRISYKSLVKRGRICKPGAGKGGNQSGEDNHRWNASSVYHGTNAGYDLAYRRVCYKYWEKKCVACGEVEGLIDIHHIDGNRKNCHPTNLVPLCRHCHLSKVHRKAHKTPQEYIDALIAIWPGCRSKIAELSENIQKDLDNSNRSAEVTISTGATTSG